MQLGMNDATQNTAELFQPKWPVVILL